MTDRSDHNNPANPPAPNGDAAAAADDAFAERVVRYLSGTLDADAVAALGAEMRANPARREIFVGMCLLEARLGEKLAPGRREFASEMLLGEDDDEEGVRDAKTTTLRTAAITLTDLDAAADDVDEPELQAAPNIPKPPPPPPAWWQRRTTWAAAAVVLLAVGVWGVARLMFAPPPAQVATLSGAQDVSWDLDRPAPAVGSSLTAGTELGIHRGLLRLTFRNGAEVVVQGPARFIPETESRLTMGVGRLSALVPPAAKGFTVRTPTAEVVDLGTEFGVDATGGAGAPSEVVVFDGHVTLQPAARKSGEPSRMLTAGTAARIDAAGAVTSVPLNATPYVRLAEVDAIERAARGSAYDRWLAYRYELARDPDVVVFYPFEQDNKTAAPDRLVNRSAAGPSLDGAFGGTRGVRPQWVAGRFPQKAALQFGGAGFPRVTIPDGNGALDFAGDADTGRSLPFTIAAWVKARPIPAPGSCILGRGLLGEMQYGLFTESAFYRGRVCPTGGEDVATFDANSAHYLSAYWHLAVMAYDPAAGTVSVYVDGQLAETRPAPAVLNRSPGPILVGCRQYRDGKFFAPLQGVIDELVVLRRAMTAAEVRRMYDAGTPGDTGRAVEPYMKGAQDGR